MKYVNRTCLCGEVKGIGTDTYQLFKGIRYAHAKRWESPEEVTSWDGVYDATCTGPWCLQRETFFSDRTPTSQFYMDETADKPAVVYSEDCLNLNIWVPEEAENAPVLVWIHGGSYETGGGYTPSQYGAAYCKNGIIVVTINYRLNVFASAVGGKYTGNYGLQDQICALRWIKRNISSFGGNPDRVTIMGESAGAMSVQNLIFSPLAKGLFHGAIMLSGGGILPEAFRIKTPETAREMWDKVRSALGAEDMVELKTACAKDLFSTWEKIHQSEGKYSWPTTPVIDGITIPEAPRSMAEKGNINAVPAIIGVLSEDMWPHTLYSAAIEWATMMDRAGFPPVYGLLFDRAVPGTELGAYHGADVRYAFGTFNSSWRPYSEIDYRISGTMIHYFSNFVKTGDPNGDGLTTWESITEQNKHFMHFGDEPCEMQPVAEERLMYTQTHRQPFPCM